MSAAGAALNGVELKTGLSPDETLVEKKAPNSHPGSSKAVRSAFAVLTGAAAVAAVTYGGYELHSNVATAGFLYLLVVVLIALVSGFREATVISIAAVTCLNYFFIPPVLTFVVADPQNWVALAAFELTALVVSRLSTTAKEQARIEARHRLLVERLYELSRRILLLDRRQPAEPQIEVLLDEIFRARATVLPGEASAAPVPESSAGETVWRRPLGPGSKPGGVIVLHGGELNSAAADAIASLAAIALERARSFDAESRAEAVRQSEQLRAAVLDALGHAFKSPLTVIRAASSGLLETGHLTPSDAEMVTLIDQESDRLTHLTSRLLRTARIDEARLHRERASISALLDEVLAEYREQLRGHEVRLSTEPADLAAVIDRELVATGLGQLVDNAAKYSDAGSTVLISATKEGGEIVISVHNEGPPIRPEDQNRIFERFYRASGSDRVSGTGLGLSIAKQTAEAHGGRVWVVSEERTGTTFFYAFPQEVEGKL